MIPRIDATALLAGDPASISEVAKAAAGVGFMSVYNTPLGTDRVAQVIEAYRGFF